MSSENFPSDVDPYWEIVQDFELSPDTLSLLFAVEDNYVGRNIGWQYEHQLGEEALRLHYRHLIDYLDKQYDLPSDLSSVVFDYHHANLSEEGSRRGY